MYEYEVLPAEVLKIRKGFYNKTRPIISNLVLDKTVNDKEAFTKAFDDLIIVLDPVVRSVGELYITRGTEFTNRFCLQPNSQLELSQLLANRKEDVRINYLRILNKSKLIPDSGRKTLATRIRSITVTLIEELARAKYFLTKDYSPSSYESILEEAKKYA